MLLLRRALALFLPVAVGLSIAAALVEGAVQHDYRTSANDPQLQIATDAAYRLDGGVMPGVIAGGPPVELARSLATHVSVYDLSDNVLASTARLGGTVPVPLKGVLETARRDGTNLLTWQPESGVRVAAVVVRWNGGTVLVGRSLSAVESRETDLDERALAAWVAGLAALAATALVAARLWPSIPLPVLTAHQCVPSLTRHPLPGPCHHPSLLHETNPFWNASMWTSD